MDWEPQGVGSTFITLQQYVKINNKNHCVMWDFGLLRVEFIQFLSYFWGGG